MSTSPERKMLRYALALFFVLLLASIGYAQNQIEGEIQFVGTTKIEKTSGVWIDGQYVGYLDELKGDKKVMLLPGEHEITVRQSGYRDFVRKIVVEPGQKQAIHVTMERDFQSQFPNATARIKISVVPDRAAVFVDDRFVGHAHEFGGVGRAMLVSPGKHRIKVALPGYQTFETEINLIANQKAKIKTELVKGSITQAGPLIKQP